MVRVKDKEVESGWNYPCYGIDAEEETLVYFNRAETGTCLVVDGDSIYYVGEYESNWDMSRFSPIPKGKTIEIDT